MLEKLSGQIVDWQIRKGILESEERAVYQYAYELLLNQTINILLAVLIAIVFAAPVPVILFLLSYIPLRSFCGGYHANTNLGCTVVSSILICCVCWISNHLQDGLLIAWYPLIFIIAGCIIVRYAPVSDRNKPLDATEFVRYRVKCRMIWAVESAIGIMLYFMDRQCGMILGISQLILSCMMLIGIIKNKKKS